MPAANQDQKLKAAELVAKGRFTNVQIAKVAQISLRTLSAWKALPEFQQQVREVKDAWRGKARGTGLADQDFRLRNENDRYNRLRAIINARAKDPQMLEAPGGKTGLLTVTYKSQTTMDYGGEEAVKIVEQIPEYEVDTGLLREMRGLEEQAARELGQWIDKKDAPVAVQVSVTSLTLLKVMTPDERFAFERKLLAAQHAILPAKEQD